MKYVNHEELHIVIFSDSITHAEMAKKLGGNIIGAGFVDFETKKCYGESLTLGFRSDEKDNRLLQACLAI